MPRRNQDTDTIRDFDGIHRLPRIYQAAPDVDGVGPNGLYDGNNMILTARGDLVPRPNVGAAIGVASTKRGVKRNFYFPYIAGTISITFDGTVSVTGAGTIYTAAAGSDLAVLILGARVFFSVTPASGTAGIWVWDAVIGGSARAAAGLMPTGTFTVAVSGTNGNVEPGQHIYAISFETDTGFITKPNLYVSLTSPAVRKKTDLNPIPTGPSGTVARHILMSRVLRNWDGNLQSPELFFAMRIADNSTTSLTGASGLDKFDTDLVATADYLKDIREELPTSNALCFYGGRMALAVPTTGVRVSQAGDYETFLNTEGYIKSLPTDGGDALNIIELNSAIYIYKDQRTYAAVDNGQSATRWPVAKVDSTRGCGRFGAGVTQGGSNDFEGGSIILTREGPYFFTGRYEGVPLSFKIQSIWNDLIGQLSTVAAFYEWSVAADTTRKLIYVFVGRPSLITDPDQYATTQMIVGDYSRGLTWDKIRWFQWQFYYTINCMTMQQTTALSSLILGYGANTGGVQGYNLAHSGAEGGGNEVDLKTDNSKIDTPWSFETGEFGNSPDGGSDEFEAVGVRIAQVGTDNDGVITVKVRNLEDSTLTTLPSIAIVGVPVKTYLVQYNKTAERVRLRFNGSSGTTNGRAVRIEAIHNFASPAAEERPL